MITAQERLEAAKKAQVHRQSAYRLAIIEYLDHVTGQGKTMYKHYEPIEVWFADELRESGYGVSGCIISWGRPNG